MSFSNSSTIGLALKVPTPAGVSGKVSGSVNLYNAAVGVTKLIQGGASYVSDYLNNIWSGN